MAAAATSAMPTALPSGISAPLETISGIDGGGLIAITTAFALGLVMVALPIRIYVRVRTSFYKVDDYAFLAASVFAAFQAAAVFFELHRGLGKLDDQIDETDTIAIQKAAYASDILYIASMFLSKACTAFLFLRLTPSRGHFVAVWSTIAAMVVWLIMSILLVAIRCHPSHPWSDVSAACTSLFLHWQLIAALDVVVEVALFAISVYLVWGLQMPRKSKLIIVTAFGCRLPVIALIGLRLYYLNIVITSFDPTNDAYAVSCTQFEIGYSIFASIIPCLKPFMAPYEGTSTTKATYPSGSGSNYKLASFASSRQDNSSNRQNMGHVRLTNDGGNTTGGGGTLNRNTLRLRPEETIYEAKAEYEERVPSEGGRSIDSGNSRRMIIKKNVEWSIDYDGNTVTPPANIEEVEHTPGVAR